MNRSFRPVLAVVACLLLAAGCAGRTSIFGSQDAGGQTQFAFAPAQRQSLGEFGGPDLTDPARTLKASDFTGKIVFINFWGSWCGPCRAEAADLQAAWTTTQKSGRTQFLGVNVRDTPSAGAAFLASKQITYPSISDPSERTLLSLPGYPVKIPSSILLDRKGQVAYIWLDVVSQKEVESAINALAQET